jgi:hypothetical protein
MNTENWNCLTMTEPTEEEYRHYDGMVATALEAIWELSSEHKVIRLYRFDRKNKAHMCILRIALMARDLYQYPVEVDASWWEVMCLNHQLRKNFDKVKRFRLKVGKNDDKGVNVPMMIDGFRAIANEHFGCVNFKEIYEAYYERKM